jgi:hypothetical protein
MVRLEGLGALKKINYLRCELNPQPFGHLYKIMRATELQGSYTATQQDQAIGTVLVRVVIRAKNRA